MPIKSTKIELTTEEVELDFGDIIEMLEREKHLKRLGTDGLSIQMFEAPHGLEPKPIFEPKPITINIHNTLKFTRVSTPPNGGPTNVYRDKSEQPKSS